MRTQDVTVSTSFPAEVEEPPPLELVPDAIGISTVARNGAWRLAKLRDLEAKGILPVDMAMSRAIAAWHRRDDDALREWLELIRRYKALDRFEKMLSLAQSGALILWEGDAPENRHSVHSATVSTVDT
jgi:hypothetical protein